MDNKKRKRGAENGKSDDETVLSASHEPITPELAGRIAVNEDHCRNCMCCKL